MYQYGIMASECSQSEKLSLCRNKYNVENLGVLNTCSPVNWVVLIEARPLIQAGSPMQAGGLTVCDLLAIPTALPPFARCIPTVLLVRPLMYLRLLLE